MDGALAQARQALIHEYGWDGASEQALLRAIIEELEPPAQEYFKVEIEDGVSVYAFVGYGATVTRSHVTALEEQ